MSRSVSPKCFQVRSCQHQHHFLSSIYLRSIEEESTAHEKGSVHPRKWMAVILPWFVKSHVILSEERRERVKCKRNADSRISDVSLSFVFDRTGSCLFWIWIVAPYLNPALLLHFVKSTFLLVKSRQTLHNCPFIGMVSMLKLSGWADICLTS